MFFLPTKGTADNDSSSNDHNPPHIPLNKLHRCPHQCECRCKSADMESHIYPTEVPPPYDPSRSNTGRPSSHTLSYRQQFIDKIRDTTSKLGYQDSTRSIVDRKSLYHGMKLVEIAVEEFEYGNDAIGLDVYLCGLDKIITALSRKFVF